jgi:hypothetical protein
MAYRNKQNTTTSVDAVRDSDVTKTTADTRAAFTDNKELSVSQVSPFRLMLMLFRGLAISGAYGVLGLTLSGISAAEPTHKPSLRITLAPSSL